MKEATGELNMAVIVAISVSILVAFFFYTLWPMINKNFQDNSKCQQATCDCSEAKENDYKCECWIGERGESETFSCPYGG